MCPISGEFSEVPSPTLPPPPTKLSALPPASWNQWSGLAFSRRNLGRRTTVHSHHFKVWMYCRKHGLWERRHTLWWKLDSADLTQWRPYGHFWPFISLIFTWYYCLPVHCQPVQGMASISFIICKKTEYLCHFYFSFDNFLNYKPDLFNISLTLLSRMVKNIKMSKAIFPEQKHTVINM